MQHRFLFLLLFLPGVLLAQTGKVSVTDLTRIRTASNPTFSPDGKKAVYAVQSVEPDEANKWEYVYRTHLWLTDFQNPPRQLTRGEESVSRGIWQDDRTLLFTRVIKGKSHLFRLSLDGGEPQPLTDWKYGISAPVLSPDGSKIVFSVSLGLQELLKDSLFNPKKELPAWSFEKPGFKDNTFLKEGTKVKPNPDGSLEEIRAFLNQDVTDKKAKVINRLNFQGEATTQPEISVSHLCLLELKDGAKPTVLTTGFKSFSGAAWTADSKAVLASTGQNTDTHPDREQVSRIVRLAPDGTLSDVYRKEQERAFAPVPSPDGKYLLLITSPSEGVSIPSLVLIRDGGTPAVVRFDRAPSNFAWSKDGAYVYFTAASNGGQPLYRLSAATLAVEQISDVESGILDFDVSADKLLYVRTEVANPNELFVVTQPKPAKKAKTITLADWQTAWKAGAKVGALNEWVAGKRLSYPEKRTFKNEKGLTIEYWIMKPTGLEAGKKYPLLLNMHGGPTAMWGPGELSMWHEFQYFCAQGYGIVYANPRGSGGYGLEFQRANVKDWGTGPASDVLTAASDAAKEAWVDTSRQVITGGSYAGYLTAWIVGHDHRFKAAFAQRGVYDLTTFLGEGNAWRLIPAYFQYPWLDKTEKVLESESPYTFVDKIRTPLLIKHGENDLRTGVIQSEMMYKSMKIMGKEVEYVRMPGGTHELSRSGNVRQRIDRMLRIYEFFERYVRR